VGDVGVPFDSPQVDAPLTLTYCQKTAASADFCFDFDENNAIQTTKIGGFAKSTPTTAPIVGVPTGSNWTAASSPVSSPPTALKIVAVPNGVPVDQAFEVVGPSAKIFSLAFDVHLDEVTTPQTIPRAVLASIAGASCTFRLELDVSTGALYLGRFAATANPQLVGAPASFVLPLSKWTHMQFGADFTGAGQGKVRLVALDENSQQLLDTGVVQLNGCAGSNETPAVRLGVTEFQPPGTKIRLEYDNVVLTHP
jgi:hypothetical protein